MKMKRLSPVLLLLALAGPVSHAQDIGPGVMIQELASLSEAGYAQDTGRGRRVFAPRQARRTVEGRNAVDTHLEGRTTTSALRIPDTQGPDDHITDRAR